MKTKIIYISGNEVFEMSEIRAAFDEVRSALGLDNDTILFGVPVDNDNALDTAKTAEQQIITDDNQSATQCNEDKETTEHIVNTPEIICEHVPDTEQNTSDICEHLTEPEINNESEPSTPEIQDSEKIIPILSVLAVSQNLESQNTDTQDTDTNINLTNKEIEQHVEEVSEIITDINDGENFVTSDVQNEYNTEKIAIGDILDDEAPVTPVEKSLEQLLESMTPLREDTGNEAIENTTDVTENIFIVEDQDTDATLAQLASEFAENEDKIVTTKKSDPQGKISKLKNILPFKKAKRDDSGLMGDLFGWAGIAANDDDFTMPGFFTGAKKQGA